MCLPYCTEFGFYLLNGIDRWINNVALIFVVWSELVSATVVYRWTDVQSQTGFPAFVIYNFGYFGGQIVGVSVAHGLELPAAGAGAGFGLFIVCAITATLLANNPDSKPPSFWSKNIFLSRFWYLAFYSVRHPPLPERLNTLINLFQQGNQLRHDLNFLIVGPPGNRNKNWSIPTFWPILLRYASAPILAIVFSFAYPEFHTLRADPLMIAGFILAHICLLAILLGFVMPRYYEVFVPAERREDGAVETFVNELKGDGDDSPGPEVTEVSTLEDGGEDGTKAGDLKM